MTYSAASDPDPWRGVGPTIRRQCPICDWHMDEPPPEVMTEWGANGSVMCRVRQHSALPAALFHILTDHPGSVHAAAVRAECGIPEGAETFATYGRVVDAVEGELRDTLLATYRGAWPT